MEVLDGYRPSKQQLNETRKSSKKSDTDTLKKCVRKGNMICIANTENISMPTKRSPRTSENVTMKTRHSTTIKSSIDEPMQNIDEVLSGESLYKTYTFEQSPNDEETEKCIAFWKSVMEKNLKPIKCAIIQNSKTRQTLTSVKDETIVPDEKKEKKCCDHQKNEGEEVHEAYRMMWLSALREIKRKKLHEVELIGKSRCRMCESLTPSTKEEPCAADKGTIKKEIQELNDWQPKAAVKGFPNKMDHNQQKRNQAPVAQDNNSISQAKEEIGKSNSQEIRTEKPVARDSKKYKYTNIIEEKKKTGAYSDWRKNMLKSPCACEFPVCDCSTNPAVMSVERVQTSPLSDTTVPDISQEEVLPADLADSNEKQDRDTEEEEEIPQERVLPLGLPDKTEIDKDKTVQDMSQEISQEKVLCVDQFHEQNSAAENVSKEESVSVDQSQGHEEERVSILSDWSRRKGSVRESRALSLMLKCACGSSSCDCVDIREFVSRSNLPEYDKIEEKSILHKHLGFSSRQASLTSSARASVQISEKVITHHVSSESLHSDDRIVSNEENDSPRAPKEPTRTPSDEHMNNSLTKKDSVEVIRRRLSSIDPTRRISLGMKGEADIPKESNEGSKRSLVRVNSIEIIRRRMSSITPTASLQKRLESMGVQPNINGQRSSTS